MVMRDDSVAPDAEPTGAPELAGRREARATQLPFGRACTVLSLVWLVFFLYAETDLAAWLDQRLPGALSRLTGWKFTLVPPASDTGLAHLLFAVALATLSLPQFGRRREAAVPVYDWLVLAGAIAAAIYLVVFRANLAIGNGLSPEVDLFAGAAGVLVLLFAVQRALGTPAFLVATVFVVLAGFGEAALQPQAAPTGGEQPSLLRVYWLGDRGVFGRPFDIAISLIMPLVLFGSLWLKAGVGIYFAKLAAACFGGRDGGAGKATVTASLLSACYAPSARANTQRILPATVPLMEGTGFRRDAALTIARAASAHAQLAPPIMAGAIILIADHTGVSIARIALHAILPVTMAYIALYLFVHFNAERNRIAGLPTRPVAPNRLQNFASLAVWGLVTCALVAGLAFGHAWLAAHMPGATGPLSFTAWALIYISLLWSASRRPDLYQDEPGAPVAELAPLGATLGSGLYLLLPLFFLVLETAGADRPAGMSMLYCAALAGGIVITHHPVKALFRGQYDYVGTALLRGARDLVGGMVCAVRAATPVVIAAAACGLVLASASLSGIDGWLVSRAEYLATHHWLLAPALGAGLAMVLAAGMPTAIGYLLLSALVVPVVSAGGGSVPAVTTHLFVLYMCIVASDPLFRRATLPLLAVPFVFIANPELLLIGVEPLRVPVVAATAVLGAVAMASAIHRHLVVTNRLWETAALALIALTLLHPGLWLGGPNRDLVYIPALMTMGAIWLLQLRRQT